MWEEKLVWEWPLLHSHWQILPLNTSSQRSCSRGGTGPLNIGGKARWKFLKIRLICTDKNSKFSPKMFRLQQALAQIVNFCSDCPSGLKNGWFWGLECLLDSHLYVHNHTPSHSAPTSSTLPISPDFTQPFSLFQWPSQLSEYLLSLKLQGTCWHLDLHTIYIPTSQ